FQTVALTNITGTFGPNIAGAGNGNAIFTGFVHPQFPLPPEPALSDGGSVAFYATVNGATINGTNIPAGIFRWDAGTISPVALQGDVAPGSGAFYRSIEQTVTISSVGGGLVAFKATLTSG